MANGQTSGGNGAIPLALSRDIRPGAPVPLHCDGQELVAWRTSDGAVRLWRDRCPHRGMRLSFGFVSAAGGGEGGGEERLHCLYHGWGYGADGACRAIPAHPDLTPPRTIRAEALPAGERGGLVWLGEPGDAPEATGVRTLALPLDAATARPALRLDAPWRETDDGDATGGAGPLLMALTPRGPGACALHVLLAGEPSPERRRAASRWGAALRDRLARQPMEMAAWAAT